MGGVRGGRGGLACIAQWWPIVSPALTLSPPWPVKQGHHTTHTCPPVNSHNWTTTNKWCGRKLCYKTAFSLTGENVDFATAPSQACSNQQNVMPSLQCDLQCSCCCDHCSPAAVMDCSRDYAISGKNMLRPRAQALECCRGCPGKMVFNLETPVL